MMSTPHPHSIIHRQALDFWVARGAVLMVVVLQLLVINDLSFGPRWLAPTIELAMLAPLAAGTAWTQVQVPAATTDHHWQIIERHRLLIRRVALLLTAVMSVMNCGALIDLVRALVHGLSANGTTLLIDALNIWVTNVIIFALWFWNIDRGGPPRIGFAKTDIADFLFPQMTLSTRGAANWVPGFVDYLFLSFTNATAFSPTDTMPLTGRAKILMMVEAIVSLLTVALVAARAVNILT
ncbi:hypothetical protein [Microvirga massiliensis]|uniref:hypothetical protein n=1 Tax=Microvirga massiliensis TaxID=1033741 RepID=UPI00062B3F7D|nr:hypothetical protein [Microvirga massiliensis]